MTVIGILFILSVLYGWDILKIIFFPKRASVIRQLDFINGHCSESYSTALTANS